MCSSRTSDNVENLLAFALYVAFPRSVTGRYTRDYYASSVT